MGYGQKSIQFPLFTPMLSGGLGASTITQSNINGFQHIAGHVGIGMQVTLHPSHYLTIEGLYQNKGAKTSKNEKAWNQWLNYQQTWHSLDIPMMYQFLHRGWAWYGIGFNHSFLLHSIDPLPRTEGFPWRRYHPELRALFGIQISPHICFGATWNLGLRNMFQAQAAQTLEISSRPALHYLQIRLWAQWYKKIKN